MNTTLTVCTHCKGRGPDLRLYRLTGVGQRVLCFPCFNKLDRLGMNIRRSS